jgi:hypothetical protein
MGEADRLVRRRRDDGQAGRVREAAEGASRAGGVQLTTRSASGQDANRCVPSSVVLVLAVAEWVWVGVIFAAVALGVIALARRA